MVERDYDLDIPNPSQVDQELPSDPAEVLQIMNRHHAELGAELDALRRIVEELQ